MRTPPFRLLAAAAALALLPGCSDAGVDVDAFSSQCGDLRQPVALVDDALRAVGDEDLSPEEAGDRFRAAQDRLKAFAEQDDGPRGEAATELRTQLGFFRIAVDSNNYDGSQDADVRTALDAVVQECT